MQAGRKFLSKFMFPIEAGEHGRQRLRPRNRAGRACRRAISAVAVERLESRWLLAGDPIINEFVALNNAGITDQDGSHSDWIEIYNPGGGAVNLSGWHLTDDAANPAKWTFPGVTINAGAYLKVFASDKNRAVAGQELHTNFKLDGDGEYLALVMPDGVTITTQFSPQFPQQIADVSYGFVQGTSTLQYMTTPTPGAANVAGSPGFVADTKFSLDRGFYDTPIDVAITTATVGAQIRYTLDGSKPTSTTGTIYSAPVHLTTTTTLRAAAFLGGYIPSDVDTETYIYVTSVTSQTTAPAGYPTNWTAVRVPPDWNGLGLTTTYAADYTVEQNVINTYGSQIRDALKSLPSVSLVMPKFDFFGSPTDPVQGIYSNPLESAKTLTAQEQITNPDKWERGASVEWINPDGSPGFQTEIGLQMEGGWGRRPDTSGKHSFRIDFKTKYGGVNELDYPVFAGTDVHDFNSLVLRASNNDAWSDVSNAQYMRDLWMKNTQTAMGDLSAAGGYVHVFINGIYWGLYNVSERPSADFMAQHLGGDPSQYDVVKGDWDANLPSPTLELVDGNLTAWNAMWSIADSQTGDTLLTNVKPYLDVNNLIDYMLLNLYGGTDDWPEQNWGAGRLRTAGAGFQFFSWDAEMSLNNRSVTSNLGDTGSGQAHNPANLFEKLRSSPEFRQMVMDRAQKFLTNGGVLTVASAQARYQALVNIAEPSIKGEAARWGDQKGGASGLTRITNWTSEKNTVLTSWMAGRTGTLITQLTSASLYNPGPTFSNYGGSVSAGTQLTITANAGFAGTIYYTVNGTDPRATGGGIVGTAYSGSITINSSEKVMARVRSAGGSWSALVDATFFVGPAPSLRIAEVMYHPAAPVGASPYKADDFEYIELQNTGASSINLAGIQFTNGISFTFSGGSLAAGARAVLVVNQAAFQSRYGAGIPIAGTYTGLLDNNGERLRLATGLGQTIEDITYSDGWYSITDGDGYSLVAIDPNATDATLNTKDGWRPSNLINGGPSVADPGINPGTVVINEVLSNTTSPAGAWIELKNASGASMDISGWFLSDDPDNLTKYVLPANMIVPGNGYLTLMHLGGFGAAFSLSALGGGVYLSNSDGSSGAAGYREAVDFGASDPNVSFGRYLKSDGDTDFWAMTGSTPGAANAAPLEGPVVINEVMYHPSGTNYEFIELRNISNADVPLYDPANPANTWKFMDGLNFTFPAGAIIPRGGYILVVPITPATFRSQYSINAMIPIYGPSNGVLDSAGEKLELGKPGPVQLDNSVPYIVVDRVHYDDKAPWPITPDGTGPSAGRLVSGNYGNDAANWAAEVSGGSPGRENFDTSVPTADIIDVNDDPRNTSVASMTINFTELVTGFDISDLTLNRNGGANLLTGAQTLTTTDGITYTLNNLNDLTYLEGSYTLQLSGGAGPAIKDLANHTLTAGASDTFTVTATSFRGAGNGSGNDVFNVNQSGGNLQVFINIPFGPTPSYTVPLASITNVVFSGGGGADTLNVDGVAIRFNSDAQTTTSNLTVNLTNGAGLTLDASQHLAGLNVQSGSVATMLTNGGRVLKTGGLTIGAGKVDLMDNDLLVATASVGDVQALLASGYNGGDWHGNGIVSTLAGGNKSLGYAAGDDPAVHLPGGTLDGEIPGSGSVVVKFTYTGDATLDGSTDGSDVAAWAQNFTGALGPSPANPRVWAQGDWNFDGSVDGSDVALWAQSFTGALGGGGLGGVPSADASPAGAQAMLVDQPANTLASSPQSARDTKARPVAAQGKHRRRHGQHRPHAGA